MPFGWGAPDSAQIVAQGDEKARESPMPFGWGAPDSLQDAAAKLGLKLGHQCLSAGGLLTPGQLGGRTRKSSNVTNAFRLGGS